MAAEWFAVMTLQAPLPHGGGFASATKSTVLTVKPQGATRVAIYEYMRGLFPDAFANANVVFFAVEPNRIGGETS